MATPTSRLNVEEPQEVTVIRTVATASIGALRVFPIPDDHPLASVFGAFNDEPLWDDWMRAIREYRDEENAKERATLPEE